MYQSDLQGVEIATQTIRKNKLCEHIDCNVPVEFDDTKLAIRHEPDGYPKILQTDSG